MPLPLVKPPALTLGDTVGLAAPAGVCDADRLQQGVAVLESWGLKVRNIPQQSRKRYMAGADAWRASQLSDLFEDSAVKAVLPVRGGFGCARMFEHLDLEVVRNNPKLFVGFSDVTVLLVRFLQEAGLVCYHGPMVATDLPRMNDGERERFRRFLFGEPDWFLGDGLQCWRPGTAEGVLTGGCLSVLVTTLGTGHALSTEGRILFLEDIAERPYRIDRMLTHLRQAGKLEGLAGVVFGAMTDCDGGQGSGLIKEIAMEAFAGSDFPVVFGFNGGHLSANVVLPFGCRVGLDADAGRLRLLEPAHG